MGPGPKVAPPGWQGAHPVSPSHPPMAAGMKMMPHSSSLPVPKEKPDTRQRPPQGSGQPHQWPLLVLPGLQKRQIRSDAGIRPSPEGSGSAPTPRGGLGSPEVNLSRSPPATPSPGRRSLTNLSTVRAGMDHLLLFFSKQESSCPGTKGKKLPLTQACHSEP